jgi:hypothetical protein
MVWCNAAALAAPVKGGLLGAEKQRGDRDRRAPRQRAVQRHDLLVLRVAVNRRLRNPTVSK